MNIETLIDTLVENGNKATLKGIEQILDQASWEANSDAEVTSLQHLIDRMYPSKLEILAKEMGLLYRNGDRWFFGTVTKYGYEAYFEGEDAICEAFIGFTNLATNKDDMYNEANADDIRAVYPQFFEKSTEEVEE